MLEIYTVIRVNDYLTLEVYFTFVFYSPFFTDFIRVLVTFERMYLFKWSISYATALLYNLIFTTNVFPEINRICLLHKFEYRYFVANYRPIAIVCSFGKIFQLTFYVNIYRSVKTTITPHQQWIYGE